VERREGGSAWGPMVISTNSITELLSFLRLTGVGSCTMYVNLIIKQDFFEIYE
jgi:hypothetical protein